jgi:hypothetical protein
MTSVTTRRLQGLVSRFQKAGMAFGLAVICSTVAPTASLAQSSNDSAASNVTGDSGFSWFANGTRLPKDQALATALTRKAALQPTHGSGSWVCSPAGFGTKSKCRRR